MTQHVYEDNCRAGFLKAVGMYLSCSRSLSLDLHVASSTPFTIPRPVTLCWDETPPTRANPPVADQIYCSIHPPPLNGPLMSRFSLKRRGLARVRRSAARGFNISLPSPQIGNQA